MLPSTTVRFTEVYGVGRTPLAGSGQWRQAANLAALIKAGDDPPAVICEACHQHDVQAFLSLRMNDCHHTDDDTGPLASDLWMAHPEYRLQRTERDYYSSAWDYSLPQVRQQRLAIICEAAEKYDTDGIELDFLRSPYLFNRDEAEDNQDILTDLLRQAAKEYTMYCVGHAHAPQMITISSKSPRNIVKE